MKIKGLVIVLTVVVSLLCVYYLSFTFVARNIRQDAFEISTDKNGIVNLNKRQAYLDSIWNLPVYNLLGTSYTYKEVKENELSLGLDLQGGMHVTLEVSPREIIHGLANYTENAAFQQAMKKAGALQKETEESFSALFFRTFLQDNPGVKLSSIFANQNTKGRIAADDSDREIIDVVNSEIENAIDRSFTILRNRLDQFGTAQPNIQRLPGTGRIQVEIPGADNPQRVRKLLQGVARLEFRDVVEPASLADPLSKINDLVRAENVSKGAKKTTSDDLTSLLGDSTNRDQKDSKVQGGLDSLGLQDGTDLISKSIPPGAFRFEVRDTSWINEIFRRNEVRAMLPRNINIYWEAKPENDGKYEVMQFYFLDAGKLGKARLTGDVVTDAMATLDEKASPAVSMIMNAEGTRIWAKWTAEASSRSPRGRIAIVLDDKVYSAPYVNGEIPNGNSQIAGNFTVEESKDLANILKAGALPAPTRIVEEAVIGPTLGTVAQKQGFVSMACGLVLVVVFMVGYYGKAGLVANVALIFNVFFILGILAQLDASLTLPGIAGIVLTMGMAVDANVIVFERIREELRHGHRLREAILLGFRRSFWTIFDSNITTFLTALMLYLFGQGPVKGFAITLMVGIFTTFFTAVYVSRLIIHLMTARRDDVSHLSFTTFLSKFSVSNLNIDFIGRRKIAYVFSGMVLAAGLVLMAIQGLNYGVDFTGGRSYIVTFGKPVVATDMKVDLTERFNNAGTEVKNFGSNNVVKVTTSFKINEESEEADEEVKSALIKGISESSGLQFKPDDSEVDERSFTISSSSKVGATIADDIKSSSIKSALLSLVVIFLYILIRFRKWQFSTGAIVSVAHDALFVFCAFAIAGAMGISFEVDQVFVAAVLTVIGYSINDTVIIFDRIREYLSLGTTHNRTEIFNNAINSTLNRTIITSGTTLMVVIALLIFGGEVLRGFSFALLIGIGIGTYSSVFIAAPVVLDLEEERTLPQKKRSKIQTVNS